MKIVRYFLINLDTEVRNNDSITKIWLYKVMSKNRGWKVTKSPPLNLPLVSWDTESDRQKLSFWSIFCHFTYNNPKYQKFEKMKKASGDVINLHLCAKNHNHVMYASWDMECNKHMTYGSWNMDCNRQNFWPFSAIFGPFTPLPTQKIKILQKWKPCLEVSSF